jgi:hypoxanthine phosphoribosyltransferase
VSKIKDTPELKDVFDYQERIQLLQGAFNVDRDTVGGKRILLVDDLYRSGATATVVEALLTGAQPLLEDSVHSSKTASMFAGELVMARSLGTLWVSPTLNSKGAARRRTAVCARG